MARSGERKSQILQTLAQMLEGPSAERITTAALAARIEVSEAALYRHHRFRRTDAVFVDQQNHQRGAERAAPD